MHPMHPVHPLYLKQAENDIKMRKMHGGFSSAGLREAFFVSFTAIFMSLGNVFTHGGAVRLNGGAV